MVELQTRPPTGKVAYPLVLIEHEEKAGGSAALLSFASSERVGRVFVLDTGDGTADEYASLGPYEVLVHDGTWPSIIGQIEAATKVPMEDGKPNVVGIDHGSAIWLMLKSWTDSRARRSNRGQQILKADPDAEVEAATNLWNDAKGRWGRMLHLLKNFDGIGVLLAHGADVTKFEAGQPTKEKTWSIEAEKTTEGAVSAIVVIRRDPREARLVGVRSLTAPEIPTGGLVLPLPMEGLLDHLVFDVLGAGGFASTSAVAAKEGMPTLTAMAKVLTAVQRVNGALSEDEAKAEAGRLWMTAGLPKGVEEVDGDKVTALLLAIAEGRTEPPPDDGGQKATTPPQEPQDGPGGEAPPDAPEEPETPTEPPGEAIHGYSTDGEADDALQAMKGPEMVTILRGLELPVSGKVDELRDRIRAAWGLPSSGTAETADQTAEEAAANVEAAFGGADEVTLIDVPDGWVEGKCLCGEPLTYPPGKTNEAVHLDPELDKNHPAEEPF